MVKDYIHYSNCWEDTDILITAFDLKDNVQKNYLSIASAGDNTFAILSFNPSLVLAVDFNLAQIALVELKKIVIQKLDYEQALEFLGIKKSNNRLELFKTLEKYLSYGSYNFFLKNNKIILNGVIHAGKFEKYFNIFRKYILRWFLDYDKVDRFMEDINLRRDFFYKKVNSKLGRFIFRVFFSNEIMGLIGRNKNFFKYSKVNLSQEILDRIEAGLIFTETKENSYLEYILKGNFEKNLPYYLKPNVFYKLKNILNDNPEKLIIYHGSLYDALESFKSIKFDGFNLSDVFEYMATNDYLRHLQKIKEVANKKAILLYWNMLVDRFQNIDGIVNLFDLASNLFKNNQSFFYRRLVIQQIE
ncbi:MAG: BtaA family protein [bacterium]|nr:BtaA family protein [bacterium]